MLYMAGDNNLEAYLLHDLEEMAYALEVREHRHSFAHWVLERAVHLTFPVGSKSSGLVVLLEGRCLC